MRVSKAYGLMVLLSLMSTGYLMIEGLAQLTLKESRALKTSIQQFPSQRRGLRRRWLSIVNNADLPQTAPVINLTLMGLSTSRDGVDVPLLQNTLNLQKKQNRRVLSLSGSGGTLKGLSYLVAPILKDPRYTSRYGVIFLHPIWFGGWHPSPPLSAPPQTAPLFTRLKHTLKRGLTSSLWIVHHRRALSQGLNSAVDDVRHYYLNHIIALPEALQVTPHAHPWYKRPVQRRTPHIAPSKLTRQWSAWVAMGKGLESSYLRHQEEQFDALRDMIDQAEGRVQRWLIVRMAEHSRLRSLAPSSLIDQLTSTALSQRFKTPVVVWDASAVVPDSGFFDYAHLNAEGRARFTQAFQGYMRAQFNEEM